MRALAAATPHCLVDTAIGAIGLAWSEAGITCLQLPGPDRAATERRLAASGSPPAEPPEEVARAIAMLERYCRGERVDFSSLPLDLSGVGAFDRAVYEAAREVRWGQTVSYGEIARRIGAPEAARAVGRALGRNPVAIVVPCHRILASGGRIGGFSAFGGARAKQRLLALEGVHPGHGTPPIPGLLAD